MKVIAYTALHYGSCYLSWAIRSVIDHIDELHVLYSATGSHGHRTDVLCPDTRAQLKEIASAAAGDKLRWHDGDWRYENEQRESIYQYAPDADAIFILDADEIWTPEFVEHAIDRLQGYNPSRQLKTAPVHFWRSFHKAIRRDPAAPTRVIYPKFATADSWVTWSMGGIAHMGYAQRSEIVRYKLLTHGHKNEFRRDVDWLNDVFMANRQYDTHPVGSEYWNPETVNPLDFMPAWMADHPYFNLEVIP